MKIHALLESQLSFNDIIIEALSNTLDDIEQLSVLASNGILSEDEIEEALLMLDDIDNSIDPDNIHLLAEKVDRQFRRYGDKFLRQYRCQSGPKKGRMVSSPEMCGKRKDPLKVRQGKKAARIKKGSRVRKTVRTKKKTLSKMLSKKNNILRGDAGKSVKTAKSYKPKTVSAVK